MNLTKLFLTKGLLIALFFSFLNTNQAQMLSYPISKKVEQTDEYFGTKIQDPYRWLEDDRSAETGEWVKQQNEVAFSYLEKIPYRKQLKDKLEKFYNYPKYSTPNKKGKWYYFYKNDGLQNQAVLYRQLGLKGTPEEVIDPNKLSKDGTTRLTQFELSKNGKYAAYAISMGGSDWQEIYVMNMDTKQKMSEKLEWVKVSGIAWQGDGFYYSRYPKPEGSALAAKNENHQVFYHKIGTTQAQDELVYEDNANPQRFHIAYTSEDQKFTFLTISDRGKGKRGNALWYRKAGEKDFKPIVAEVGDYDYGVVENIGNQFLIQTNDAAPNDKIVLFDPKMPEKSLWKTIIAEKSEPLRGVGTGGGKLFATYLKDVTSKVLVYDYSGKLEREVDLPGLGTVSGFGGDKKDKKLFYVYTSFTAPPTIYQYDIATGKSSVFRALEIQFNPNDYETKQIFYPSKDGTKIPMFITYKKGMQLNANNPTLLYAYGGFNVNQLPSFSSMLIPFLDQGGVYALANLRGGAEYGEKWHEAGMLLKKQNVFDDFIAAAEYLIREKYTSSQRLAIRGGSNGGLLVGTVMNQRPELFKVAIPQVGVMDMLRFHKFTIGWNWIAEYGSSERNEAEFKNLLAYSPLHNLKEGVEYPATLVTTADHDDRVVPAHSFKYIAALQEKYKGNNPVLIRIDVNSGHGSSNTAKAIEQTADIYAFIFYNMGVTPKF